MKPALLILHGIADEHLCRIGQAYDVVVATTAERRAHAVAEHGHRLRAVMTIGAVGLTAEEMAAMPLLEFICALGAGFENIDMAAARARGIAVANGAGTNDACVADHTIGLLIASARSIPQLDMQVRKGVWRTQLQPPRGISGKRLGILGLGTIGQQIARRAAGFDMTVAYHNRRARTDVAFQHVACLHELATWADFLVVAVPGGAGTRHLVNADILQALGPEGVIVNIARGSVIDTQALASALRSGTIAAAGLDVYESEPAPPVELLDLDNVVLTPHVAGWSPQAITATIDLFLDNMARHFSGRPLLTPI